MSIRILKILGIYSLTLFITYLTVRLYLEIKFFNSEMIDDVAKKFKYFFVASIFYIGIFYLLPLLLIKFFLNKFYKIRFEYYITILLPILLYLYFGYRGFAYHLFRKEDFNLFINQLQNTTNEIVYVIVGTIVLNLLYFLFNINGKRDLKTSL